VKEKRKGPISRAGGLVDSVAATVRRMQRDREPRVLAYDPTGYARLIQPEARGHERILEIGEKMVAVAAGEQLESGRSARGASEPAKPARKATAGGSKSGTKRTGAGARSTGAGTKRTGAGAGSARAGAKSAKAKSAKAKSPRAAAKGGARVGARSAGAGAGSSAAAARKRKRTAPKEDA
jgi:hypothetical protein